MPSPRRRLDTEIVRRSLAPSRQQAREAIEAGQVLVSGAPTRKPGRLVRSGEPIVLVGSGPRFVSRAGEKLDAALSHFALDPTGIRAIDVGASTGGFSDCLLQRGAAAVVAIDVGHGQLHERLRDDPRVTVLERCNVRDLEPNRCSRIEREQLVGPPAPLVVADLSFISLRTVRDALVALAAPGADMVLLIKPQFEAGRREAARGRGVITDPGVQRRTLLEVLGAYRGAGADIMDVMVSPIRGAQGNLEALAHLRAPAAPTQPGTHFGPSAPADDADDHARRLVDRALRAGAPPWR